VTDSLPYAQLTGLGTVDFLMGSAHLETAALTRYAQLESARDFYARTVTNPTILAHNYAVLNAAEDALDAILGRPPSRTVNGAAILGPNGYATADTLRRIGLGEVLSSSRDTATGREVSPTSAAAASKPWLLPAAAIAAALLGGH